MVSDGGGEMKRKRILILVNFFPPSGGGGVYRPLSFVKYLSRLSWDVTVVTPKPGEFWISDPGLLDQVPDSVRVERTTSLSAQRILNLLKGEGSGSRRSSSGFGLLRRIGEFFLLPDTYLGWVPFALRRAAALCRDESFDVILSTSPPDSTHLAAEKISTRFNIPWVADFRDPWIGLYLREPPTPLHRAIHQRMESRVASADRVLVTTDWQKNKLLELYPDRRIEKIANGYDNEDFKGLSGLEPDGERFTITHTGMLTLGRKSRDFLEGLAILAGKREETREKLRVIFAGGRESMNEEWVRHFKLEEIVEFRDNLPHDECVKLEKKSHVLLLIKHDDKRYNGLVPGKLYEYIGARRPILAVVPDGEARDIVLDHGRGKAAKVGDPADVARKLGTMFDLYLEGRLEGAFSLDEIPEFSREAEAERLDEILEELVKER